MFSKACEYAIKAGVFIATETQKGNRCSLKTIAAEIDSPEAFTAKILQQLSRNNLIVSTIGSHGGFEMDIRKAKANKLSMIVELFDGNTIYKGCGLGLKHCSEVKPCPMHDHFKKIREELREMLENTTVYDLSRKIENGNGFLKR